MVRNFILVVSIFAIAVAAPVVAGGQSEAVPSDDGADAAELERTTEDPRLHEPGKLTVATGDPVYPPWMLNDDPASGEGFENGIVYALAEEMGFDAEDVVWVRQTFDQGIAPGPKDYDFAINQYSVTEERREFVDFSIVYYQPRKAALALPDSAIADAESFADLRDADWGATIGTTDLDYLENTVGADGVAVFDDQVGTFQALLGGQIDATVISLPTALYVTAVQVPEARIVAILPADVNDLGHGVVFEKGNPLVPWVDDALQVVMDNGVVDQLADEYLVGDDSIPEITE